MSNDNFVQFTPRTGRITGRHTNHNVGGSTIAQGRLGGGIGLNGSTASSRAMLGSESAKGLGVGSAGTQANHKGSRFDLQLGRDVSATTLKAQQFTGQMGLPKKRPTHRIHGGLQSSSVLGVAPKWRFLKEGVIATDGSALHSMQPLPQPIPLTQAAKAYLEQYERAMMFNRGQETDGHSFTGLLQEQQRVQKESEILRQLQSEHAGFQHAHGLIPFEEFVDRRDELLEYAEQHAAYLRGHSPATDAPLPPASFQPRPPSGSMDPARAAARSSLRSNFLPANVVAGVGGSEQSIAAAQERSARSEFLRTMEKMDRDSELARRSLSGSTRGSVDASRTTTPMLARPPSSGRRSRPISGAAGSRRRSFKETERAGEEDTSRATNHPTDESHPQQQQPEEIPLTREDEPAVQVEDEIDESPVKKPLSPQKATSALPSNSVTPLPQDHSTETDQLLRRMEVDALVTAAGVHGKGLDMVVGKGINEVNHAAAALSNNNNVDHTRPPSTAQSQSHQHIPHNSGRSRGRSRSPRSRSRSRSSSRSTSRSTSRGSSPVILWRATNRVKEALDLPAELRSVFLEEPGQANGGVDGSAEGDQKEQLYGGSDEFSHNGVQQEADYFSDTGSIGSGGSGTRVPKPRKSTRLFSPQHLSTLERIAMQRSDEGFHTGSQAMQELEWNLNPRNQAQRAHIKVERNREARRRAKGLGEQQAIATLLATKPPPPTDSSFTYKGYNPRPRKNFGAWFLPTRLWIAEDKKTVRSHISQRVNTGKAHMSLGGWNGIGFSIHGKDVLQVGQAEYEEARLRSGRSGLASWEEVQSGALLGSSTLQYDASGTGASASSIQARTLIEEEDEDLDVKEKINLIKAQALEARARRRRHAELTKVAQYERGRQQKKASIVAKQLEHKGIFTQKYSHTQGDDAAHTDDADFGGAASNPLLEKKQASLHATTTGGGEEPTSLEERVALLRDQIPHLQIAQEYKSFVQRLGARVPHYLSQVEASKLSPEPSVTGTTRDRLYDDQSQLYPHQQPMHQSTGSSKQHSSNAGVQFMHAPQTQDDSFGLSNKPKNVTRNIASGLAQRVNLSGGSSGAATDRGDYRFR